MARDPVSRSALRASTHLRRFMPLYVFGTIWAFMLMAFPTIVHNARDTGTQQAGAQALGVRAGAQGAADQATADTTDASAGDAAATDTSTAGGATGGGAAAGTVGGGTAKAGGSGGGAPPAKVEAGTGKTIAGDACAPNVRQVPRSLYAPPCVNHQDNVDNGGATYNGVTKDTIKISVRVTADAGGPNAATVNQIQKQAGQATTDDAFQYANTLLPWFNSHFELYGRKVVLEKRSGNGNGTDEAQSKGQAAACQDANDIASSQHAFGVVSYGFGYISQPFSECAKQYKLWIPMGAAYFPEEYYQRWDPYVWAGTMECDRIATDVGEYIGKRLANKPPKWAGSDVQQSAKINTGGNRKFGTYVPNNDGYQHCVDITVGILKNQYHQDVSSRYNYTLDVSQFPSEAARGITQFQADHDTTIVQACDPISSIFLTQAAAKQQYHPEWFIIGVAAQDTDGYARLWDQSEVDGHLFGLSQLGSDKRINDPNGEAALAWKEATKGQAMPNGAGLVYYEMLQMFSQLQVAGPQLTPANIATGTHAMPPGGGPTGAVGTWDFSNDHTAINDSREIYYTGKANGYDGKAGTYLETYGGKRFSSGQWPAEDPPVYPNGQ
ncbi:MAG TPA: hypothetical protein VHN98_07980 [Acidimicrobiales bacterium]|nr:hypothetical protein [Acidimicrobiales bacterium]